jgi:hypothetical protein
MSNPKGDKKKEKDNKDSSLKPDPETLHKTDPQENMKGPISSVVQNIKEGAENSESKESADKRKDENT